MDDNSQNLDSAPRRRNPPGLEEPVVMSTALGTIEKADKISPDPRDAGIIRKAR